MSLLFTEADIVGMLFSSGTPLSACSLPNIPHWAGIHCRTALLVAATSCRALVRFGSLCFYMPAGRRGRQRGIQLGCSHDLKPALWRQPV